MVRETEEMFANLQIQDDQILKFVDKPKKEILESFNKLAEYQDEFEQQQ